MGVLISLQTFRLFCLLFTALLIASCSSLEFISSGNTPFKVSVGKESVKAVEIESTADFYFWGISPGNRVINLDDEFKKWGLDYASFVTVEQTTGWKSMFYTIVTLGLYCPIDYKISLLTNKGLRN